MFLYAYGLHIRQGPLLPKLLTGERLARRVLKMKPSALALDGWGFRELRALPVWLLGRLASLVTLVEALGRLSIQLAVSCTAIPLKERPLGPLHAKPLRAPRSYTGNGCGCA